MSPVNSNPWEQRRTNIERINSMQVQLTAVSGFVQVNGAGEVLQDVNFPVWFTEKPTFTFGGELMPGSPPVSGKYPTVSVVVVNWTMEQRGYGNYYVGAKLAIVTTGDSLHQMIIHWNMEAKAIRNPIGPHLTDEL